VRTTLLVEPEPSLVLSCREALYELGHDVLTASTAAAAITHLREGGVDVLIVDAADGAASITPILAALEKLLDAPPLLLVSGRPDGPELSAHVGAAAFLPLPCDPAELVHEVARITGVDRRTIGSGTHSATLLARAAELPPLPAAAPMPTVGFSGSDVPSTAFDDEPTGPGLRPLE